MKRMTYNGKTWTKPTVQRALNSLNEDIAALQTALQTTANWDETVYRPCFGVSKEEGRENMRRAIKRLTEKRDDFARAATEAGLI